ncbi:MAG: CheR family methyltransferase, partial [Burkholderiales bacterium]
LQALIEFRPLNLLAPRYDVSGPFDVIFCRNVMIYFDKPTQRTILEKFAPLLAPDGLMFCGHSENFTQARDLFQLDGKTVYRLAAARSAKAA